MPNAQTQSVGGLPGKWDLLQKLVVRYGSPLYVYDLAEIEQRYGELQVVLPADSKLLYSVKANPALLSQAAALSLAVEASSSYEINQALAAGVLAKDIWFSGPGKTPEELAEALRCGIMRFSIDSVRELVELDKIARHYSARPGVLLRINPDQLTTAGLSMSGIPSQFGIPIEQLDQQRLCILQCSYLDIVGVHVYMGTQIQSLDSLAKAFQLGVAMHRHVSNSLGIHLPIVNLGGGFPWPYAVRGTINLTPLRPQLSQLVKRLQHNGVQLWFESGRYLAASCGTLVSRVIDLKVCRNTNYLVLDAGIHCLGGMSGLGRTVHRYMDLLTQHKIDESSLTVVVVGPSCTPLDVLCTKLSISRRLRPMDLVQVPNVGAYGLTASLVGFLGKTLPTEVFIRGQEVVRVLRLSCRHIEVPR